MVDDRALPPVPGRRIRVVGTAGCGKTTLARRLAHVLRCPHVELDALYWEREWTPAPQEVFRERTAEALAGDTWTVDGNYSLVRDILNSRSDTIIWLDYRLPRILVRLLRRTVKRVLDRESLWGINRQSLRNQLGRDSLLLYAVRTHSRRRQAYWSTQDDPSCAHLAFIRLRDPRKTERWLDLVVRIQNEGSS